MTEHGTFRSTTWGRGVVALAMTVVALAVTTSVAGASTAAGGGHPDFGSQARTLGLSSSQAKSLQIKVDGYLAKEGGTQVAANRIQLPGADLTVALPGEKYARDSNGNKVNDQRAAAASCTYTNVCAYSKTYFGGDKKTLYTCNQLNSIPWVGDGSWINNQNSSLRARFYDINQNVGWISPGGYSEDLVAPWGWVHWLSPC
ncbi:hypothetical protein [Streptomyces sp. NPDC051561]|uniref:hypothetical protein n=1 Tax=Streptomyces sp. NPDC051561 TaxID=3365658 RepID=UPI00378FCC0B